MADSESEADKISRKICDIHLRGFSPLFDIIATKSLSLTGTPQELKNFEFCRLVHEYFKKEDVTKYANLTLLKLCTQLSILFMKTFFTDGNDNVYIENNRAIADTISQVLNEVYDSNDKEKQTHFYIEIEKWMSSTTVTSAKEFGVERCFLKQVEEDNILNYDHKLIFENNFEVPSSFEVDASTTESNRVLSDDVANMGQYIYQSNMFWDNSKRESCDLPQARPKAPGPEENNVYESLCDGQEISDSTSDHGKVSWDLIANTSIECSEELPLLSSDQVALIESLCHNLLVSDETQRDGLPQGTPTSPADMEVQQDPVQSKCSESPTVEDPKSLVPESSSMNVTAELPIGSSTKNQVSIADIDNLLKKCNQLFNFKSKITEKPEVSSSAPGSSYAPCVDTPGETPCDLNFSTETPSSLTDIVSTLTNCHGYFGSTDESTKCQLGYENNAAMPSTEEAYLSSEICSADQQKKSYVSQDLTGENLTHIYQNENVVGDVDVLLAAQVKQTLDLSRVEDTPEPIVSQVADNQNIDTCKQNDNSNLESFVSPATNRGGSEPVPLTTHQAPIPQVPSIFQNPNFMQLNFNPYINPQFNFQSVPLPPLPYPNPMLGMGYNFFYPQNFPVGLNFPSTSNTAFSGLNTLSQGSNAHKVPEKTEPVANNISTNKSLIARDPRRNSSYYRLHLSQNSSASDTSPKESALSKADSKPDSLRKDLKKRLSNEIGKFIKMGSSKNITKQTKNPALENSPPKPINRAEVTTEDAVRQLTGNEKMTTSELLLALEGPSKKNISKSETKSIFTDSSTDNSECDLDKLTATIQKDNLVSKNVYLDQQYTMFDSPSSPDGDQADMQSNNALDLTLKTQSCSVNKYPSIFSQRSDTPESPLDLSSSIPKKLDRFLPSELGEILDLRISKNVHKLSEISLSDSPKTTLDPSPGTSKSNINQEDTGSMDVTQSADVPADSPAIEPMLHFSSEPAPAFSLCLALDEASPSTVLAADSLFDNIYQKKLSLSLIEKSYKINNLYKDSIFNLECITYCQISALDHIFCCLYKNCSYYSKEEDFKRHLTKVHSNDLINWECPICGTNDEGNQSLVELFHHLLSHTSGNQDVENLSISSEINQFTDTSVEDIHQDLVSLLCQQNQNVPDEYMSDLDEHVIDTYEYLINPYKCGERNCIFSTVDSKEFRSHNTHHNKLKDTVITQCMYCYKETDDPTHHTFEVHSNSLYQCPFCLFRGSSQISVAIHQACHRNKYCLQPVVIKCYKLKTSSSSNVSTQIKIPPYKCPVRDCLYCPFVTADLLEHLELHLFTSLACKDCNARFYSLSDFLKHALNHGIGKYHCSYCRKCYNNGDEVLHHILIQHKDLIPKIIIRTDYASCCRKVSKFFGKVNPIFINSETEISEIELDSVLKPFQYFALVECVKRGRKAGKIYSDHRIFYFKFFNSDIKNILKINSSEPSFNEIDNFIAYNAPKHKSFEKYQVVKIKREVDVVESAHNTLWNPRRCFQSNKTCVEVSIDDRPGTSGIVRGRPTYFHVTEYQCKICAETYLTLEGVHDHYSNSHPLIPVQLLLCFDYEGFVERKFFVCCVCNIVYTELSKMDQHLKIPKHSHMYCSLKIVCRCCFCEELVPDIEKHCEEFHEPVYTCAFCTYFHRGSDYTPTFKAEMKRLKANSVQPIVCPLMLEEKYLDIEVFYVQSNFNTYLHFLTTPNGGEASSDSIDADTESIICKTDINKKLKRKVSLVSHRDKLKRTFMSSPVKSTPSTSAEMKSDRESRFRPSSPSSKAKKSRKCYVKRAQMAKKSTSKRASRTKSTGGKIGYARKSTAPKLRYFNASDDVFPDFRSQCIKKLQPSVSSIDSDFESSSSETVRTFKKSLSVQHHAKNINSNTSEGDLEANLSREISKSQKKARQTARKSTTMSASSSKVKVAQTARKSTCTASRLPASSRNQSDPGPSHSNLSTRSYTSQVTFSKSSLDVSRFSGERLNLMKRPSMQTKGKSISKLVNTNKINMHERLRFQPDPVSAVPDVSLVSFDNITEVCELLSSDE